MLSRVPLIVLLLLSSLFLDRAYGTPMHFEIMEGSWYGDGPADPLQIWTFTALSDSGNVLQSQGSTVTPIRLGEPATVTGYPLWQSFTLDGVAYQPCLIDCPGDLVSLLFDPANGYGELTGAGCLTDGPCVTFRGKGEATIEKNGPNFVGRIVFLDPPIAPIVHAPEPASVWLLVLGLALLALLRLKNPFNASTLRQQNH
jgi:hypothetical protein